MIDDRELFERSAARFAPPGDALERFTRRRVRRQRNRRISAGVVAIVVALAVTGWLGETLRSAPGITPAPPTHGVFEGLDGRIAFAGEAQFGRSQHYISAADPSGSQEPVRLPIEEFGSPVAWSRDGRQLLLSDGVILRSDGSTVRIAEPRRAPNDASFSPDGSQLVFNDAGNRTEIISTDGQGRPTFLSRPGSPLGYGPQWSPKGSEIALMTWHRSSLSIVTISPQGGPPHTLVTYRGPLTEPGPFVWSPDGSQLALSFNIAPDKEAGAIWVVNADGTHLHPITPTDGDAWGPTWSPDGQRIAFVRRGHIVTVARDGRDPRTLPGGPVYLFDIAWNPVQTDVPASTTSTPGSQTVVAQPAVLRPFGEGKQALIAICVNHVLPCTLIPDA